ncbi:hypothetical protein [Ranid herpesvirus 3]|uniref:Uncharacterized protein n=1 Tax=Ranid herpesvirus 3 TaxID=1987509 RepID=A0A1X9T5A0_9VIRU|nr:hypothetical protein [Ranid herpesvirus 3]ARR28879.1 hypothetical protein [Ranid herpesvirus 3]
MGETEQKEYMSKAIGKLFPINSKLSLFQVAQHCDVLVSNAAVTRFKFYCMLSYMFGCFVLFVGTDSIISFIDADKKTDTAAKDEAMYGYFAFTAAFVAVTTFAFFCVLVYSFFYLRRMQSRHGKKTHNMFHITMKFHTLYLICWVFYLMCGLRAITVTDCSRSNPINTECAGLQALSGTIGLIFVASFLLIMVSLSIWAKLCIHSRVNPTQNDNAQAHWTVSDEMHLPSMPVTNLLPGTTRPSMNFYNMN